MPEFIRTFWYASLELGQAKVRTDWGAVATDDRYPLVWDANNASVLERVPTLTTEELRAGTLPYLAEAGARFEHIEFWETSVESPALAEYRRTGERRDPDVAMVYEGDPANIEAGSVSVDVVTEPTESFWAWYRDSLREFGMDLSEDVLDQMTRRAKEVFLPAGLRFFVGAIDGELGGYTSLVSLEGVGYIDNVVTVPGFRRRGVATATVLRALEASRRGGDGDLFLLAELGGYPQRLYERLGFRVRAEIESFTRPIDPSEAGRSPSG